MLHIVEKVPKVIQRLVDPFIECNTAIQLLREGILHVTEQMPGSGESKGHRPKLAQNFVPLLFADTALRCRDAGENLREALKPPRRELDGHAGRVNDPAEHDLDGAPRAIALV